MASPLLEFGSQAQIQSKTLFSIKVKEKPEQALARTLSRGELSHECTKGVFLGIDWHKDIKPRVGR